MSNPVDVFPDAEAAAGIIMRAGQSGSRVYSSIPNNPTYPLAIVRRIGGTPVTRMRLDAADLQIDVWAETKSAARLLAVQHRQSLHQAEGTTIDIASGDAFVTGVTDVTGLTWLPDPAQPQLNRYMFSVRVFLHAA